jgi:hypothetical protein
MMVESFHHPVNQSFSVGVVVAESLVRSMTRKRMWRLNAIFLALAASLVAGGAGLWSHESPAPETPRAVALDPFDEADMEFRALYERGRAATLARLGPIIVVELDDLVLVRNGKRVATKTIPSRYHRLKSVSHMPLAIYVALAPFGDAVPDEPRRAGMQALRKRIAGILESLPDSGFDADQLARSRSLLARCSTFLDNVLDSGKYSAAELNSLTRAAGPIVLANAADAAKAQIDSYHACVSTWRREIPADEWGRLRVLVLGPQMPRKRNVAVQYFAKLLGVPGESRRVVYAEELAGESQGLNLLATHQLDSELSEAFFADPDRMEIDLIGNAASVYLDGLDLNR